MTANATKRRFLQSVGGAAGAAAVYRAMDALGMLGPGEARASALDLAPGSGAGKSVVVLGAGVSGMIAAYELSKAGYDCTILEATARAGGRNLTARAGDAIEETDSLQTARFDDADHLYANLGPARIPHHHRTVLGYCREFGIDLEVFANDNRAALLHNADRFGGRPVTARRAMTDLRGYVAELLAKAVNREALDDALGAEDKERILEMLVRFGALEEKDLLYKGSNRGGYRDAPNAGLLAGEANDPLDFSELLRADFWRYKLHFSHFLNQNPTLFQPVGGMDAIPRALEARVGRSIRHSSPVAEIRKTGRGVRVVHADGPGGGMKAIEADFAVCTIPAPVLRDIPNDFSPAVRAALAEMEFVEAVKIAFQARRRFWEEDSAIYGGISWTDRDITQIWYPCHGYHLSKGVAMGAYIWDREAGLRFTAMSPAERLEAALAEGEALHPGYREEMENGIARAWLKAPFQKGGWPRTREPPEALREPDGAIHFAGDQVTALPGWQEGAALAAHAAAAAIHRQAAASEG